MSAMLRHGSNLGLDSPAYYQKIDTKPWIPLAFQELAQVGEYVEHIDIFSWVAPHGAALELLASPLDEIRFELGQPVLWPRPLSDKEFELIYEREGVNTCTEPICYVRRQPGTGHSSYELCDEFRLFTDSFLHSSSGLYTSTDIRDAHEEVVARVDSDGLWAMSQPLKRYLGARESVLVVDFRIEITRLGCDIGRDPVSRSSAQQTLTESFVCTTRELRTCSTNDAPDCIQRRGRTLVNGLSRERCCNGVIGKETTRRFSKFAVGLVADGSEVESTCEPIEIFRGLQVSPEINVDHYTPTFFSREVLKKYYDSPSIFGVQRDEVACASWTLPCCTELADCVIVPLGHLGSYLPYDEQLRWRAFNQPALGAGRATKFGRFRSWSYSGYPNRTREFAFKSSYESTSEPWESRYGWSLFLSLNSEDSGLLKSVHTPFTNDQAEFDVEVTKLEKLLCSALNERELVRHTPDVDRADEEGSLNRLEAYLASQAPDEEWRKHVVFLRDLRLLRDCAGHMKGGNYRKANKRWRLNTRERPGVFEELLTQAILFLEYMGKLSS